MDFRPRTIARSISAGITLTSHFLRVRQKRAEQAVPGIIASLSATLRATLARNRPSRRNYDRYRSWRGGQHHEIGPKSQGSSHSVRTSGTACSLCNSTGSIIRGHDGRKIRCPGCRRLPAP